MELHVNHLPRKSFSTSYFNSKINMLLLLTSVKVNSGIARDASTQKVALSGQQRFSAQVPFYASPCGFFFPLFNAFRRRYFLVLFGLLWASLARLASDLLGSH